MHFTAKDVCKKAITVDVTKKMSDARDIMLKYNISRVVIENNQKPVGIITEKDIGQYLYKENIKSLDEITISKAIRTPLTSVSKDIPIDECTKVMLVNNISSLIVTEGDGINIFTKSDLVKIYAEHYKGKYKVGDFMTRSVFTMSPSYSLHTALKILIENKISRVIVTQNNKIIGIITARDLMPITAFVEGEKLQVDEYLSSIGYVMIAGDVMKKPITVKDEDDISIAAQILTERKISGLPVIDSNTYLIGIITKTDIVKALIESGK